MNRSSATTPVKVIKCHNHIPRSCKRHPKIGEPAPKRVPRLQLVWQRETSPILYAKSRFNSKPPAGIIMTIKAVALTFSHPKYSSFSPRASSYTQRGVLLPVCASRSKARVCAHTYARLPVCCGERGGDASEEIW